MLKSMSSESNVDETKLEGLLENKVNEIETNLKELIQEENDNPELDKSIQTKLNIL